MKDVRRGYALFFDELNAKNDGKGLVLNGKKGTASFAFKFNFTWMDDHSDAEVHEQLVKELLDKNGPYDVHFLGGSHPTYAQIEMDLANENDVLNYQCCVRPDEFYEQDFPRVFGIPVANTEYTRVFLRMLTFSFNGSIAFAYDRANDFTRTTCEAGISFAEELGMNFLQSPSVWTFEEATCTDEFFREMAQEAKASGVEVLIGCLRRERKTNCRRFL